MMEGEAHKQSRPDALIERLVTDTGITKTQARDLIAVLGRDWSSLVREARLLQKAS